MNQIPNTFHGIRVSRARTALKAKIAKTPKVGWIFSTTPCGCGKNHFALAIESANIISFICPASLFLKIANVILTKKGGKELIEWNNKNPISTMLRRIDKSEDAFEHRL